MTPEAGSGIEGRFRRIEMDLTIVVHLLPARRQSKSTYPHYLWRNSKNFITHKFDIMTTPIDPKKTALLLLDLQVGLLQRLPSDSPLLDNAASAISTARQHGAQIAYIRVALDEAEIDAVPENNASFAAFKGNKQMSTMSHPDAPTTGIHPKLAPQEGDLVHRKIRYGPFMTGPSKAMLDDFAAKNIDTVIIGGVVTSGAVLSSVRQLADLDYRLFVLEDCCFDFDVELHNVLCEKVFSKQAKVIKSSELESLF
jgi:nicotinamidase-related amidase